jgi:hypothetical protein
VSARRTGPAIADAAEVVSPLAGRRLALVQLAAAWVDSPRDPVGEDAARCVCVVDEQSQRSRLVRDVCPAKRRRDILPVAGVAPPDRPCVVEGAKSPISR